MKKNTTFNFVFFSYILLFSNAFAVKPKVSIENFNNSVEENSFSNVFNLLKDVKQELELEKDKMQLFEDNFVLLNNILTNSNLSISEMLEQFSEVTEKLNYLLNDEQFVSSLGYELKEKVLELEKLIELFIKIRDFDLSELVVDFSTISNAINSINNFLSEKEKLDSFVDFEIPVRSFNDIDIDTKAAENPKYGVEIRLDEDGNIEEFPLDDRSLITKAGDFIVENKESIVKTSSGLLKDMVKGGLVFSGIRRVLEKI